MPLCTTLQDRIDGAEEGCQLHLPEGRYRGRLVLRRSIRIVANGVLLTGDGEGSLLRIRRSAVNVSVEGIELVGGRAVEGAAVRIDHTTAVTLRQVTIRDCMAATLGGGVYLTKGRLSMTGGSIVGCQATHGAGIAAIEAARVELARVRFARNQAVRGAALVVWGRAALTASECAFESNRSDLGGAALWVRARGAAPTHAVLSGCSFGPTDDLDFGKTAGGGAAS